MPRSCIGGSSVSLVKAKRWLISLVGDLKLSPVDKFEAAIGRFSNIKFNSNMKID